MIGEIVSHYRVIQTLGHGGMGVVYEAEDTRLHRRVALKFLPEDAAAAGDAVRRFRREAEAASALNHPHICTIYDIGDFDGRPFIVMEKLEGQTLKQLIEEQKLSVERILTLGSEIADALAAAHAAGIIHRDVKPANIFVTARGDAKLLDFGLARLDLLRAPVSTERETAIRPQDLTAPGMTVGTVDYMSPEQARGQTVDARADIFSLGAVLYEMATGVQAFRGETTAAIAAAILIEPVAPPSEMNPRIPHDLDRAILAALEKDRELRVQSAAELRAELLRLRRDRSVPATPARRPKQVWTSAIVSALLLVVVVALWFAASRNKTIAPAPREVKRVAVLPFENLGAPQDNYFADGMTDEVRGKLAALPGLEVIARTSSDQYKGTRKTPREIANELGVSYLLTGRIRWDKSVQPSRIRLSPELDEITAQGAPVSRWQQNYDAVLANVFDVQAGVASQVAQALQVALAPPQQKRLDQRPTSNLEAYDAYLKGLEIFSRGYSSVNARDAAAQFQRAVTLDPNFALAWANLSISQSVHYGWATPNPEFGEAARIAAAKAMSLAPQLPKAHLAAAMYERAVTGNLARAMEALQRGLAIAPGDVDLLRNVGLTELQQGKLQDALAALQHASDLDPRSWRNEAAVTQVLLYLHRPRDAHEAAARALALHPNLTAVEDEALAYLEEGNLERARQTLAAHRTDIGATAIATSFALFYNSWVLDDGLRNVALTLTSADFDNDQGGWAGALTDAYWLRKNSSEARRYAEKALIAYQANVKTTPAESTWHAGSAYALAVLGRNEEAAAEGEKALRFAPDAQQRGVVLYWLSRTYAVDGDTTRAIAVIREALTGVTYLTPAWLRIDPHYASLRGNPEFQKLLK